MRSIESRDFVMLAETFKSGKYSVNRWYSSEKFDGKRCLWDGGLTRGKIVRDIPWANKGNIDRIVGRATGLWSRNGNVLCAPDWFLDGLPKGMMLDGELWLAPNQLQNTMRIVQSFTPDARWHAITFRVFDIPSVTEFCHSGRINNLHLKLDVDDRAWFKYLGFDPRNEVVRPFEVVYKELLRMKDDEVLPPHVEIVKQTLLPYNNAVETIKKRLDEVLSHNGEGLILRKPFSYWIAKRSVNLLKVKPRYDAEGVVVGYRGGKNRHMGRLGALVISWNNQTFDIGTGFDDPDRVVDPKYVDVFTRHSDAVLPDNVDLSTFPLGSRVTFEYTSTYTSGKPREAAYLRRYEET